MSIELASCGSSPASETDSYNTEFSNSGGDEVDDAAPRTVRTNYGSRAQGRCVIGIYKSRSELRFYMVPDNKGRHYLILSSTVARLEA